MWSLFAPLPVRSFHSLSGQVAACQYEGGGGGGVSFSFGGWGSVTPTPLHLTEPFVIVQVSFSVGSDFTHMLVYFVLAVNIFHFFFDDENNDIIDD